jgi:o-succinylbenzoate synthase
MIDDPVRIRSARIEPYEFRLARPWRTARGQIHQRRGWFLRLEDADGVRGVGECAPMPEAGTETMQQAAVNLRDRVDRLAGLTLGQLWDDLEAEPPSPAARCGLECAVVDLAARRRGIAVARLLNPAAGSTVKVNASIGVADPGLADRARDAVARGFDVLKIKLGVGEPDRERVWLREAVSGLPSGVQLRLDANGAWDSATAEDWLDSLSDLPIESLEEPLADADPRCLEALQRRVSWPLALDESLPGFITAGLTADLPVLRVVIKPMVLGGIRPAMRLAAEADRQVVVTTILDAAPGRWVAAHLAAALDQGHAHGLDTASWLAEDIGTGPEIRSGRCRVFD